MKIDNTRTPLKPLHSHLKSTEKELQKIASGKKTGPSDAASMQIAQAMMSDAAVMGRQIQNGNENIAMLQIAGGVAQNISEAAIRLGELNVRANSASLNADQKAMLQKEFDAQTKGMQEMIQSASFNGKRLFGESLPSLDVTGLQLGDGEALESFVKTLQTTISDIGSRVNAFTSEINNLLGRRSNTLFAYSQIADTDIAESVSDFKNEHLLAQSALFARAHNRALDQARIEELLG